MRLVVLGLVVAAGTLHGQQPSYDPSRITMDRLFHTRDFYGGPEAPVKWMAHGAAYTTIEDRSIVRYDAAAGTRTVMVPAERLVPSGDSAPLDLDAFSWSSDGRKALLFTNTARVWRENTRGDYWVYDVGAKTLSKLGGPSAAPSTLMFAKFSPDGGRVAYVREHNLYVEDLATHAITALTTDGSVTTINGTFDWVYEEELNDRDGFRWSPDGTAIAYWQLDASGVRDFNLIDDTDSLYSFVVPVQFPVAGSTNSAARVGVVSARGGATTWMAVPGDARNNYIPRMEWANGSDAVILQHMNRLQNTNEVVLGDAHTGAVRTVLTEHDSSAWVDVVDDVRWLDHGKQFTWVSDRDGWRRLYIVPRTGGAARAVTPAGADLANPESAFGAPFTVGIDTVGGWIYYLASPTNPTQVYLYRVRVNGKGAAERVTPAAEPGVHEYTLSPDARFAIHHWSSFGVPPVTEVVALPGHTVVRTIRSEAEVAANVRKLARTPVEFFTVDNGAGATLRAWMMKPPAFDSTKKYPVLFTVYGGPAQQTVLDQWGGYDYLMNVMLSEEGYIVVSVDNRGTPAPLGRAWRKAIYKQVSVVETADQAAALQAIVRRPYVDATRVGIWGWSNGGTMTLNMLFRKPELYHMGMAVAPVTDFRYYDTIYSERYLGLPEDNPDAYKAASPITFADGLKGDLLLVHGSGDDNVHYQNSEALINALVAADKPFTMMDYPNRTHCICEGAGTSRHLFTLLWTYLHQHLPPGPRVSTASR
ncbi:MAG TPA: S9 family peptidase [Gemmatimonadaceae bacterium]|nr:S9 family peptidase [Gemmatimonadaceae bacterium]